MKRQLLSLFGIMACWMSVTSLEARTTCALSGVYTIDASQVTGGTNFISFTDAINELTTCGVAGAVVFDVVQGTYTEQIAIGNITGASSLNTITIQAKATNTSPVNMNFGGTSTANNYVIKFNGASYVTIRGLNIKANGSNFSRVIDFTGFCTNIIIEDNTLIGTTSSSGISSNKGVIVNNPSGGHNINYCSIRNNIIRNGNYGIYWVGGGLTSYEKGHIITNNIIEGSSAEAISMNYQDSILISNNKITLTAITGRFAIKALTSSRLTISSNNISMVRGIGIELGTVSGSLTESNQVSNNMISISEPLVVGSVGIRAINAIFVDIVFNSIYVFISSGIEMGADNGNIKVINNNIVHGGTNGEVLKITDNSIFIQFDYNNLHASNGAAIGSYNNTAANNMLEWRALSGLDSSSQSTAPGYVSTTDLHLLSSPLFGKGLKMELVSEDIDGDLRVGDRPTIGADELLTASGDCDLFTSFDIDSLKDTEFKVNWVPGSNSTSFYFEYGAKDFVPGTAQGTKISGTYPGSAEPPLYVNGLTADTEYDIYFGELCNSGSDTSSLKKLTVTTTPPCPLVENIFINTIGGDSVTLTINSFEDQFDIEIGPAGYEQGTGTLGTYGRKVNITGLSPLTSYDIYIRSNCSSDNNGFSTFIGPISFTTRCLEAMNGSYTVGGASGPRNFSDFREAADELNNCGVSGPVVIEVAQGVYDGGITIGNIYGANATNTVTIKANPANTQAVELVYASSADSNYVLQFNNASYISIEGISLKTTSSGAEARVVSFMGKGSHINLKNDTIVGMDGGTTTSQAVVGMGTGAKYESCTFEENTILGGAYGISIESSASNRAHGNIFNNNSIEGWTTAGISTSNQDSLVIKGNRLRSSDSPGSLVQGVGIRSGDYFVFSENEVVLSALVPSSFVAMGLQVASYSSSRNESSLIANNMISVGPFSAFIGSGLYIDGGSNISILNNSVLNAMATLSALYINTGITSVEIYNNNLISSKGGPVAIFDESSINGLYDMDYNNLYTTGSVLAKWGAPFFSSSASDLASWQTATSTDSNSYSVDPLFISDIDLHSTSPIINNVALPLDRITIDIDGDPRSATNPDIGADEFTPPPCVSSTDLDVLQYYSDSLSLYWNPGDGDEFYIEYDTSGFKRGEGIFISGITDSVHMIKGLTPQTSYDFYLRDYCGISDTSVWVGPFTFTTPCADADLMSGTYTIDLNQPTSGTSFASFNEAIEGLNECGVKAPVTFEVVQGDYYEQIVLGDIYGASNVNTITFQPHPANTAPAELKNFFVTQDSNYIVRFQGSKHIIIKGLTLYNGTTNNPFAYGRVLEFTGECSHILIEENVIGSFTTFLTNFRMALIINHEGGDNQINYITIRNNTLQNGSYAILWNGSGSSNAEIGNVIEGNSIEGYSAHGITASYQDSMTIKGNTIISTNLSNVSRGIFANGFSAFDISANKVTVKGYAVNYGIRVENSLPSSRGSNLLANNMISLLDNTTSAYGLYIDNSSAIDILYNSVLVNSGLQGGRSLYVTGLSTNNLNVYNNNLVNAGGGYAVQVNPGITDLRMDYNNLYSTGSDMGIWNNTTRSNLADWKAASLMDTNSVSADPLYKTPEDLYASSPLINDIGKIFPSVDVDIDGNLRSATPDIGANEFEPLSKDIFIVELISPMDSSCGDSNSVISLIIGNSGLDAAGSFDITAEIGGASTAILSKVYSGMLNSGETDTITLSPFNSFVGGDFDLSVYVDFNGDLNRSNDSLHSTIHTYTPVVLEPFAALDSFCSGGYDTLFIPSDLTADFSWKTTEGDIIGTTDSLVVGPLGGSDTTFVLSPSSGCYAGDAEVALYYRLPVQIPSPVAVMDSFCIGDYDTLYLPEGFTGDFYWETKGGTMLGSDDTLIIGPLGTADTTIIVSPADGCSIGNEIALFFRTSVKADFTYSQQLPSMTEREVSFDAGSSEGAMDYTWDFGDGNTGMGQTINHSYTANGSYDVQLVITGNCGSDTISQTVTISGISIEENMVSRSVKLYPNPTKDRLQIHFETQSSEDTELSLLDLSGKVVLKKTASNNNGLYQEELDLSYLAGGSYMLRIECGEISIFKKVIKE